HAATDSELGNRPERSVRVRALDPIVLVIDGSSLRAQDLPRDAFALGLAAHHRTRRLSGPEEDILTGRREYRSPSAESLVERALAGIHSIFDDLYRIRLGSAPKDGDTLAVRAIELDRVSYARSADGIGWNDRHVAVIAIGSAFERDEPDAPGRGAINDP